MTTAALAQFRLTYALSPIILTGGIANGFPGGMLPTIGITDASSFLGGIFGGGATFDDDNAFAHFLPLPGSTLIDQQIGMYPFANTTTAANATIAQPLTISMLMVCPAAPEGGYTNKQAILSTFQSMLAQHNSSGGTYTINTPAFIYDNCVMLSMTDVSSSLSHQVQAAYKLDFIKPLITQADAAQAYSNMIQAASNGTPTTGDWGSGGSPPSLYGSGMGVSGVQAPAQAYGPVPSNASISSIGNPAFSP